MAVDGTGGGSIEMPDDYGSRSRQPSRGSYTVFMPVVAVLMSLLIVIEIFIELKLSVFQSRSNPAKLKSLYYGSHSLSFSLIPGRGDGSPPRSSPGSSIGVLDRLSKDWQSSNWVS